MAQAGWAHVPQRRPLLPRLRGRVRRDGRLRQARLRRGRDRRDPPFRPVRAGRRALLADTRLRPERDPRAALARPPRPPHRRRPRRRGVRGAGRRVLRCARPPRRLAARPARLHLSGPGGGRLHRDRARAGPPLHGGLARACLDRARARPGGGCGRGGRGAPARGPDGGVDPVDPRAGGHRRAGVRRVRRVVRSRAAPRRSARSCGRAHRPRAAQTRARTVQPLDQRRTPMKADLERKVALVAGATRGAERGSEYDRPETIEETAELVTAAGGEGIAVAVDHLEPAQVESLVQRIDADRGRLDVLVNDIWGGELLFEWDTPVWEHDLEKGLRILRLAIDTHLITSHFALALLIREPGALVVEMTDGTAEYNARNYRLSAFYDLAKTAVIRLAFAQGKELEPHGCAAV